MTRPLRRGLIGLTSLSLAAGGAGLLPSGRATAASAAPSPESRAAADATAVTGASFTWDLNQETTSGAFAPGTWNLMSAGKVGDPGAGGTSLTGGDQATTGPLVAALGGTALLAAGGAVALRRRAQQQ